VKLPPKAGQRLVGPGAIAAAFVAVGVVAVIMTHQLVQRARADQKSVAMEREAAQNKLARATDEEREIREKLVDYRKLRERGLIGEEHRIDWVERIAEIKAARRLFDVKYSIEPQRQAEYPGLAGGGDVQFMVSPMKVEMTLLHEEDLLRFIADLRAAVSSHVLVKSCTVQRLERPASERTVAPRLRADCMIDLVTIRDRQAKSG
jgi:hypothetical protein